MPQRFILVVVCAVFFNLSSCLDTEGFIAESDSDSLLVVDGILISGKRPTVYIGKSLSLGVNNLTFRIPDAEINAVILENGLPFLHLQPLPDSFGNVEATPRTNRTFGLDSIIHLQEGAEYRLVVEAEGFPTLSSQEFEYQSATGLEEISIVRDESVDDEGNCVLRQATFEIRDELVGPYDYWLETYLRDLPLEERERFGRYLFPSFTMSQNNNLSYVRTWRDNGPRCDSDSNNRIFGVIATPKEYTDFMRIRDNSLLDLGGVFAVPEELPHNVQGGYGYFGLGSSIEITDL